MRPFTHTVTIADYDIPRGKIVEWCTEQFGPTEAQMVFFNLSGQAMYEGTGEWAVALTKARFERVEHAIAFKMRWG